MDLHINNLKEILKKKKNLLKEKKSIEKPDFFWKIALISCFVLILASFAFGFYLFNQIDQGSTLDNSVASTAPNTPDDLNRLKNTLQNFSDKENKSAQIINSPSPVVDPSL